MPRRNRAILAALVAAVCVVVLAAPAAGGPQRAIVWDLHSKYITKSEALAGLTTPATVAAAGPTGLRSWVFLPNGYTSAHCWPVLYLMHTAYVPDEWLGSQPVFAKLPAIVVIPGGGNGWSTDWWNNGARSPGWEKWFFNELVPKVSSTFPICPGRSNHAIAGASMGGYEGMYLAAQRPDYFGTAASFSGVIAIADQSIQYGYGPSREIWGPPGGFYEVGHDPAYLLPALRDTRLFVDVGNGLLPNGQSPGTPNSPSAVGTQLLEAVMRDQASLFLTAAHKDQINVSFWEHNGIHNQDNWDSDLTQFIASNPFAAVPINPPSWRYATTDRSGDAWGWRFSFSQPPTTVETFEYSNGTLRLTGAGKVVLDSPSGHRFRGSLPLSIRGGALRTIHAPAPVFRPTSLPIDIVLRPLRVGRHTPLRVMFTARALPPGSSYFVTAFQSTANCVSGAFTQVKKVKAGQHVSVTLAPGANTGRKGLAWCKGNGTVDVTLIHGASFMSGKLMAQAAFRTR